MTICEKAEGTRLFGWCTTGQHDDCKISFVYNDKENRCGCIKHKT